MKTIIIAIIACVSLFSCSREEPVQVKDMIVEFKLPDNFTLGVKYSNKEVVFTSPYNIYKFTTDENGVIRIPEIIPDEYTINTTWEMSGAQYNELINDNQIVEDKAKVLLKATQANYPVFSNKSIKIDLEKIIMRSLLISKVYFSGTKDDSNRNYRTDSFVEIFNNSDEVVYLDGKYLALTESMSPAAYLAKDNPDYIYTRQICRFPGEGNEYPLEPGKSIVIATRSARDHTTSASNSVDLSDAEFEVKEIDGTGNPEIKALPVISSSAPIKYLNLLSNGSNAVFIFETEENILDWPEFFAPGKTSGERFRRVPVNTVLDGVESLMNNASTGPDVNLKRFPNIIDAGFGYINSISGYTNEVLERKVSGMDGDRLVLQDTNNSTDDFVTTTGSTPKKYDHLQLLNK